MAKYKVVFMQTALDDLEQIVAYTAQNSIDAALRQHERIIETANRLSEFPMLGRAVPDEKIGKRGFRMIGQGKYIMFYKVFGDTVAILRVLHGARDYPQLLNSNE